jgi:hypothetical protein
MSILGPYYLRTGKMTRPGLICILIVLIFTVGCKQEKTPAGILNKEEYAEYLVNVYVAEAKLNTFAITPDSAMRLFIPFEHSLVKKFDVSDSVIHKTYQYYLAHPDQLEEVFTSVIDTLNLREQKANSRPQ